MSEQFAHVHNLGPASMKILRFVDAVPSSPFQHVTETSNFPTWWEVTNQIECFDLIRHNPAPSGWL